jgi:hypothetical protein
MRSAACAFRHRVTHYTLCPLGEPEIAIGHEPRIEPWLTASEHSGLPRLSNSMTLPPSAGNLMRMDNTKLHQGNELQWAGSRERNLDSGRGGAFFLTSLFIELIDPVGDLVLGVSAAVEKFPIRNKGRAKTVSFRPKTEQALQSPLRPGLACAKMASERNRHNRLGFNSAQDPSP